MFSYIWQTGSLKNVPQGVSKYEITHVLPLIWIEHCVECAAPLCYNTCQMYKARSDGRCVRFEHGVIPYGELGGQLTFRRWAKLQALLPRRMDGIPVVQMEKISNRVNNYGYRAEKMMTGIKWNRHRPSKVIESLGIKYLTGHSFNNDITSLDGLLVSAYNHEKSVLKGLVEIVEGEHPVYKHAIALNPGWNETLIPMGEIQIDTAKRNVIRFYLEGDQTGTITFRYLDFITLKSKPSLKDVIPAKKVKCVAWDLDNTLWRGVIGDTKDGRVEAFPQSKALIEQLDKMGVIQTIVSKNTYEVAWKRVEELQLDKYFLYPAINWGRKSQNMQAIAKELNINIDTFALIDDSVFERNEVKSSLPQVRVYDVTEIDGLLNRPEFDIPITEESAKRRESYQKEAQRKEIRASYGGDYDTFLRDCGMHLEIFTPETEEQKSRCLELLQRSNQYNVSKDKRQADTFNTLFTQPQFQLFAFRVWDKWGDYGIVGFVSVEVEANIRYLRDFVMSCRVAQKKVERAFFNWYVGTMNVGDILDIDVWKTGRNNPLRDELKSMPLEIVADDDNHIHFSYQNNGTEFVNDNILIVNKL
ncbi:MAG: HAD-IIIC family phosphatase [Prevotella ruminicola]|uniref:HAD-IIIC family phosphatase n=1 Tax=Xylanibacter ruminicola TaxID=839 RepID=A0A9D5P169_XYLRU|nr:HAD-IIIC family phosphatase [Xylanibacter ruminicola]